MRQRPSIPFKATPRKGFPFLGLALAVLLVTFAPARAADDESLLLRLARPQAEGHEEASAAWDALPDAKRVALLRRGLASPHRALAEIAAAEIGGEVLSLEEIRRRQALLRGHFEAAVRGRQHTWGVGGISPAGAPDVVPLWRALAERTAMPRKEILEELHRVTLPEHLPGLAPLLAKGNASYFTSLFWTVCLVADFDASDRFRVWAERGIAFGLRRLRLERAHDHAALRALAFDPQQPAWGGAGLSADFKEVARAAWGLSETGFRLRGTSADDALVGRPPLRWLHRQAARSTPQEIDGPFVAEVARGPNVPLPERWWAMRHLLRLSPAWGGEKVAGMAAGDGEAALLAAAALAQAGRPAAWQALDEAARSRSPLAWAVDREAARARWTDAALRMVREGVPVPDPRGALALDPLARALPP